MKLHTRNTYINAWLDCSNPYISLHNKSDGDLLAHFNVSKVHEILESGDLTLEELQSTDTETQSSIIQYLVALKSAQKIKKQLKKMGSEINERNLKVIPFKIYLERQSPAMNLSQAN